MEIILDYNKQFGTSHTINEFDLYYQDVQRRIKDQKWTNKELPHKRKLILPLLWICCLQGLIVNI